MYRNRKLLDLARESPVCMNCGGCNNGTIVACHSNLIRDGKGTGIKSQDYCIFYGCADCHDLYDGRTGKLSREEKNLMFEDAHRKTIAWLFESGHLTVR